MGLITLFKAAVAGQRFRPADFNQNMTDIENAVNGLDTSRVKNTTDETIAGVKTFSSSPIVPTPTTDMQASTKKYVDDKHALQVNLTGNQTVAGVKTFSSSPIVPTPVGGTDAANKSYVEGYAAPVGHVGSGGAAHADVVAGGADGFMTGSDKTKLDGIEAGAEVNNISDVNATDLTDGGDTTLHTHDGRYYTEAETNSLLSGKAAATHVSDVLKHANYAAATGTNDYVVTLSPAPTAYTPGMMVSFKASATNTSIATLNCNNLGAVSIRKDVIGALEAGDITDGQIVTVIYDGTYFQVVSGSGGAGGSAPVELVSLFNRTTLGSDVDTAAIGIVGFDASKDTLLVFQNSTFILGDGNEYTISGTNIVKPSGTWASGTIFDFVVYKTVLSAEGFDFVLPSDGQLAVFDEASGLWKNKNASAGHVDLADSGGRITATDVEGALQEIAGSGRTTEALSHIGLLASLTTSIKTTIVAAINEIVTALGLKAPLASPTFTGTVTLPSSTSVGSVSATELGYLDGVTAAVQTQINAKSPSADPTFTGLITTAGQIKFPATQSASSDPNTLDDYEEGAFTPTWTASPTSPSLGNGTLIGTYTKIGNIVNVSIMLTMGSTTNFGSGWYRFALPFQSGGYHCGAARALNANAQTIISLTCYVEINGSTVEITDNRAGGYSQVNENSPFVFEADDVIKIDLAYKVA